MNGVVASDDGDGVDDAAKDEADGEKVVVYVLYVGVISENVRLGDGVGV